VSGSSFIAIWRVTSQLVVFRVRLENIDHSDFARCHRVTNTREFPYPPNRFQENDTLFLSTTSLNTTFSTMVCPQHQSRSRRALLIISRILSTTQLFARARLSGKTSTLSRLVQSRPLRYLVGLSIVQTLQRQSNNRQVRLTHPLPLFLELSTTSTSSQSKKSSPRNKQRPSSGSRRSRQS
jgi:hypothetical protein